ncbi:helix-turn-helix domain-containing protein [Paenibacillus chartarius]|uniref:Helix-turn-helix domain-containing protein n=1 Tax=Paenibacillus chartarius TaxID=747481 RepID=A0ABV6DSQ5_9BACL
MSELGQLLRKARIEQKISLDELQEVTKIRKRYLEAIEEGNFKVLPGSFYVRAFIKSYAETVGLDPNEVLELYQADIPAAEPEPVSAKPLKRTRAGTRSADRISRWVSSMVMVSFVLLILGALYFYFYNNAKSPNSANNSATTQNNRITDSTPPVKTTPEPGGAAGSVASSTYGQAQPGGQQPIITSAPQPQPEPSPKPAPNPNTNVTFVRSDEDKNIDYYQVTGGGKLEIQLKVMNADCWYQLDTLINGKRKMVKQEQKEAGYTTTYSLDSSAFLRVGKADSMEITLNGTVIPPGNSPNPKNIQIDLQ